MSKATSHVPKGLHTITPQLNLDNAGAKVAQPMDDQFWGDRAGLIIDPAGYHWWIATHKEDLSTDEIKKRAEAHLAKMAQPAR